jgi:hypothetical protein
LENETGRPIRYGLANDSKRLNKIIKSADLIGIYRKPIVQSDVGSVIGQFWSCEAKPVGWHYTGSDREPMQLAWLNLVLALGGRAEFVSTI